MIVRLNSDDESEVLEFNVDDGDDRVYLNISDAETDDVKASISVDPNELLAAVIAVTQLTK